MVSAKRTVDLGLREAELPLQGTKGRDEGDRGELQLANQRKEDRDRAITLN
jgi:hypothetical protein